MNNKYSQKTVRVIRSGLKTYGPVLEYLGLKPFLYQRGAISEEERNNIYDYVESMRLSSDLGLMDIYNVAGKEFNCSPETVRGIYSSKRKNQ